MSRPVPLKPSLKARGTLRDVARLVGVSHTTVWLINLCFRMSRLSGEAPNRGFLVVLR